MVIPKSHQVIRSVTVAFDPELEDPRLVEQSRSFLGWRVATWDGHSPELVLENFLLTPVERRSGNFDSPNAFFLACHRLTSDFDFPAEYDVSQDYYCVPVGRISNHALSLEIPEIAELAIVEEVDGSYLCSSSLIPLVNF